MTMKSRTSFRMTLPGRSWMASGLMSLAVATNFVPQTACVAQTPEEETAEAETTDSSTTEASTGDASTGESETAVTQTVEAKVDQDAAWIGEAVSIYVTLHSPGPFSGTPSFDLPELPRTVFVRVGNPIIGNETIDGESVFTQRHEFEIYTQQVGHVAIPPFEVRYAGKQSFLDDAVPMSGTTPQVDFESKRPPGAEANAMVVTATTMKTNQSWSPTEIDEPLQPGDVIQRTITRTATGTTSMMLPPLTAAELPGVRVYETAPIVEDKSQRGIASAKRVDAIQFQFEKPGTYELPAIEITWWDPAAEKFQQQQLEGRRVEIAGSVPQETATIETEEERAFNPKWIAGLLTGATVCWLAGRKLFSNYIARRNSPEAIAASEVVTACRENNAAAAYSAVLRWQRYSWRKTPLTMTNDSSHPLAEPTDLTTPQKECQAVFDIEWRRLSEFVYSDHATERPWNGHALRVAFEQLRSASHNRGAARITPSLPSLNPTTT